MEKSRSVPDHYSSSYYSFDYEDRNKSYNFNGPRSSRGNDAEHKRKKRLASYNVFTMEAKLKSSVRNSFKWIKSKFLD